MATPSRSASPGGRRPGPVAVGGLGGSGTRVVAQWLLELGHHLGTDLNGALDNLWFVLLLRRRHLDEARQAAALDVFLRAMRGDRIRDAPSLALLARATVEVGRGRANVAGHPWPWALKRAASLLQAGPPDEPAGPWGWKEPNTHLRLPLLCDTVPDLRYVHVLRHGLDMAFSRNQNQLHWWGPGLGVPLPASKDEEPASSLHFWAETTRRAVDVGRSRLGDRFLLLRFEDVCSRPADTAATFLEFLGRAGDADTVRRLAAIPTTPRSVGRHRGADLARFRPQDLATLSAFGYDVT